MELSTIHKPPNHHIKQTHSKLKPRQCANDMMETRSAVVELLSIISQGPLYSYQYIVHISTFHFSSIYNVSIRACRLHIELTIFNGTP